MSADMGAGHNSTGRAVEAAARRRWPDCEVSWVDALDVMGQWVGPTFRGFYTGNLRFTPWLYQFYFDSNWRHRWFAESSKAFVGVWCGSRLAPLIDRCQPDLVISTYPLGSAGLAWLRRQGRLPVPVQVWISDFAPHPFWVYDELDVHYITHDVAVPVVRQIAPRTRVQVSAPPVSAAFTPGSQDEARQATETPADAFVALVACGSLGLGSVDRAVRTLLDADPRIHVVAVAGNNPLVRRRLEEMPEAGTRLRPLGWVQDMPALLRAADVVVTNAGGATALEAMATCTPLVMFEPIAAHGQANARYMAAADMAVVCQTRAALTATVRQFVADPALLDGMRHKLRRHNRGRQLEADVAMTEPRTRTAGR